MRLMKRRTKQLLKRLLPVIALFLAINIGFGIEYYLRIPKEWYSVTSGGFYETTENSPSNATSMGFAIDTSEKIAYIASGYELLVVDFDNLNSPSFLGNYTSPTPTRHVAFKDDLLVLSGSKNITLLDISNPSTPVYLSNFSIHPNYSIKDIEIKDDIVYLAVRGTSSNPEPGLNNRILYVINVTNPELPTEISVIRRFGYYADELCIYGNVLYLSWDEFGTRLLDISDPANPSFYTGTYQLFGLVDQYRQMVNVYDTEVRNIGGTTYIFVADYDNGYIVGDVTDPNSPEPIDGVMLDDVVSVDLTSNYAFVLRETGQTLVYSLDKPSKFKIVGKFDPYPETLSITALDIQVHQATDAVFILRTDGLAIYHLREGVKDDYYREAASLSYTWIAIGLSLLICVPLLVSVLMRHRDKYAYSSNY